MVEDEERGNKLTQRDCQGIHAQHEYDMDTTAQSLGWAGGVAKYARAMTYCQARCMRLNILYAYLNALTIEGGTAKDAVAKTNKERKEYIGKKEERDLSSMSLLLCR